MKVITRLKSGLKFWHWPKKFIALALILILGASWFYVSQSRAKAPNYKYATVQTGNLERLVSASGIVSGKSSVTLHFQSGGTLASLKVKPGDQVSQGDLIANLDLTQLMAGLNQARNNYSSAQGAVDKTLDDIRQYQYGNETNNTAETMTQRQNRMAVQATRDSAYDSIKAAQDAINDAYLYSPINGTITSTFGTIGQNITAADNIAQVVDFSSGIVFEADVDEADIAKINLGQRANITLNAYDNKTFSGLISEIKPSAKTTSSGATVITIKIDLTDSGIQQIAGLNGQTDIVIEEKANVLKIPLDALRSDDTVLVKKDQGYDTVKVTPGLQSDEEVEITSGLQAGQEVITNPPAPSTNGG